MKKEMKIKAILVQNRGKGNICPTCNEVIQYDTINQKWHHKKTDNLTCRKPKEPIVVNAKPIHFKFNYRDQANDRKETIFHTYVDPREYNNRGINNAYPKIINNEALTMELNSFYEKIEAAGLWVIENNTSPTNKDWMEKLRNANTIQSEQLSTNISVESCLTEALPIAAKKRNLSYQTINLYNVAFKLFYEFLATKYIDAKTFPIEKITMQHLEEFEMNLYEQKPKRYLHKEKRFCTVSVMRHTSSIRGMLIMAERLKICSIDLGVKSKFISSIPPEVSKEAGVINLNSGVRAHTHEEFDKLWSYDPYENPYIRKHEAFKLILAKKTWQFQVLTGMGASDITKFHPDEHIRSEGNLIIMIRPKKMVKRGAKAPTPIEAIIHPEAKRIIQWVRDNSSNKYFPKGENKCFFGLIKLAPRDKENKASTRLKGRYMPIMKYLGLPALATHMPRKTCATIMHQGGMGLLSIKKQLGDSTDSVVEDSYIQSDEFQFKGYYKKYFLEETGEDTVLKSIDSVDLNKDQVEALIKKLQLSL